MNDPRSTWFIWREIQMRLKKWTLALLQGRRYTITLEPQGTGYHAPLEKVIQANPQLFPKQPVDVQFRLTQGILAHECGHAWFTGNWPDQREPLLQQLVNALEDQRIEAAICTLYPGVAPAIRLLGDLVYEDTGKRSGSPAEQALDCCLAWRWAHNRTDQAEMFARLGLTRSAQDLWAAVRPLVEQSWAAPDTDQVIALARRILDILGLPPGGAPRPDWPLPGDSIPKEGAKPQPLPKGPADDAPSLGSKLDPLHLPGRKLSTGRLLEPKPYLELEERAHPHAARLAEALKEPRPDRRPAPHEHRGRYSFRQEARTPDTPHLAHQEIGRVARSLALYLLVDRSGSMSGYDEAVRRALMTIYLAATEVGIPIGVAYFGEDDFRQDAHGITIEMVVAEVAPLTERPCEEAKALIAGYSGWAGNEYLDWGLRKAETELRTRPERLKALIIAHDGEPVYRDRSVSDWDLSLARLRALEQSGITPIGVHLGNEVSTNLRLLFPRLVNCPDGGALPEQLGRVLSSLA